MAETWIDAGPLPSNKKVYKHGALFRPYQFSEVRSLSRSRIPPEDFLEFLISGVKCTDKSDPRDMTLSDILYIGALRLFSTIGNNKNYKFTATCSCGKTITHSFSPEEVEFADLSVSFPLEEKLDGKSISITPITARQYMDKKPATEFDIMAIACGVETKEIEESEDIVTLEMLDVVLCHTLLPFPVKCEACDLTTNVNVNLLGKDGSNSLVIPFR